MRTPSMLQAAEEGRFERVPDGWIFSTWSLWIVGPRCSYFVSEAQKPLIAACLRHSRLIRLLLILALTGVEILVLLRFPSLSHAHALGSWVAFGAFVVVFAVVTATCDHILLRPPLRDLPRSPRKPRKLEMLRNQSHAISLKKLTALSVMCVLSSAALLATYSMSSGTDLFSLLGCVVGGFGAIHFFWMLTLKLRSGSS
jgi:hypothetical protein